MYNGGVQGYDLYQYSVKLEEAFEQDAQLVTVGLLPNDLFAELSDEKIQERSNLVRKFGIQKTHEILYQSSHRSLFRSLKTLLSYSRFVALLTHLLLSNEEIYLKAYLLRSSQEDSYLKATYSQTWEKKIQDAERIIQDMARRAKQQHIQLAIIIIPQRIQALLVKNMHGEKTLDAFAFSKKIKLIGKRYGVPVVDFLERLTRHSDPISLYYPVDGHLKLEGQQLLGKFIAEQFMYLGVLPQSYP